MHSKITNSGITGAIGDLSPIDRAPTQTARAGPIRYGLPCANCRLYYAAELATCPICSCGDRISPAIGLFSAEKL
jgi:hypothetical protein